MSSPPRVYLHSRGLVHGPPLHIMVELLHGGEPLLQYGRGVVRVVIRCHPEERRASLSTWPDTLPAHIWHLQPITSLRGRREASEHISRWTPISRRSGPNIHSSNKPESESEIWRLVQLLVASLLECVETDASATEKQRPEGTNINRSISKWVDRWVSESVSP